MPQTSDHIEGPPVSVEPVKMPTPLTRTDEEWLNMLSENIGPRIAMGIGHYDRKPVND